MEITQNSESKLIAVKVRGWKNRKGRQKDKRPTHRRVGSARARNRSETGFRVTREVRKRIAEEIEEDRDSCRKPSIKGAFGSYNIDQDVVVTESGGKGLSKRQEDFICVT
jgi:hypothetical protein